MLMRMAQGLAFAATIGVMAALGKYAGECQ